MKKKDDGEDSDQGDTKDYKEDIEQGIKCAYVLNHLAAQDCEKSAFYHTRGKEQILYTGLFHLFEKEKVSETLLNLDCTLTTRSFVAGALEKAKYVRQMNFLLPSEDPQELSDEQKSLWKNDTNQDLIFYQDVAIAIEYVRKSKNLDDDFQVDEK